MAQTPKGAQQKPTKPKVVGVTEISDESLDCRDLRHHWRRVHDFTLVKRGREPQIITRHLRCERCGAERFDTYSVPSFELLKSLLKYPEGYQMRGLKQRVHISDVRREIFTRNTPKSRLR